MKKLNAASKKDDANGDSVWCDSKSITSVNGKFPNIAYVHDIDGEMKVEFDDTLVVKRKFKPYNAKSCGYKWSNYFCKRNSVDCIHLYKTWCLKGDFSCEFMQRVGG